MTLPPQVKQRDGRTALDLALGRKPGGRYAQQRESETSMRLRRAGCRFGGDLRAAHYVEPDPNAPTKANVVPRRSERKRQGGWHDSLPPWQRQWWGTSWHSWQRGWHGSSPAYEPLEYLPGQGRTASGNARPGNQDRGRF